MAVSLKGGQARHATRGAGRSWVICCRSALSCLAMPAARSAWADIAQDVLEFAARVARMETLAPNLHEHEQACGLPTWRIMGLSK